MVANYNVSAKMQGVSILLYTVRNKKSFLEKKISHKEKWGLGLTNILIVMKTRI